MEAGLEQILSPDEILQKGLELVGFSRRRQQNVARPTNLERFRAHYGSNPIVYSQIWEDLLTTEIPKARLAVTKTASAVDTSRSEYSDHYPLKVFRKHIDQEEWPRKMLAQYTTKKNKQS